MTNKWMDFVCHIRWSTTSTNALRECWRDGQYMGGRTTRNAVAPKIHKFRIGQSQETNLAHTPHTANRQRPHRHPDDAVDPTRTR